MSKHTPTEILDALDAGLRLTDEQFAYLRGCVNAHDGLKAFAQRFADKPCGRYPLPVPPNDALLCSCDPCRARAALKLVEGE